MPEEDEANEGVHVQQSQAHRIWRFQLRTEHQERLQLARYPPCLSKTLGPPPVGAHFETDLGVRSSCSRRVVPIIIGCRKPLMTHGCRVEN